MGKQIQVHQSNENASTNNKKKEYGLYKFYKVCNVVGVYEGSVLGSVPFLLRTSDLFLSLIISV